MFFSKGFIDELHEKAARRNQSTSRTIVFAETDDRIIEACSMIVKKKIARPLILGSQKEITKIIERLKITNLGPEHVLDHLSEKNAAQLDEYSHKYHEMRTAAGKLLTIEDAKQKISQPHYYGAMLMHHDKADGMICGISSATKPYYPAFEIIKTREGISKASGLFIMVGPSHKDVYFFADCALNIAPGPELLSEIALTTAESCINLGIKPRLAMLSFSTRDSAKHESIDRMKQATSLVKKANPGLVIDGELQVDAALVPEVSRKKCPDSVLGGTANVLIFPDLNSGNIGYKLVERLGGYKAIGPIMQGLNKPLNDLSRGCSAEDIVDLTAITVLQTL